MATSYPNPFESSNDDFDDTPSSESPTDNSSHVKDTARHPGRKVRSKVADFIGGGTAYAGEKEKASKTPKPPLRDRIAKKIATPEAKDTLAGMEIPENVERIVGHPADRRTSPFQGKDHYHGFDCQDPSRCTIKGVGDED
jgi:hypothetical protein